LARWSPHRSQGHNGAPRGLGSGDLGAMVGYRANQLCG
jgi:hypothetical protein